MNEFIKSAQQTLLPLYVELFNLIFDTGVVPEVWLTGLVKPIYKGKGDRNQPENYRPITLLSCLGKLFTSILSDRLNTFADELHLISETQTGFRKGYSTTDNIFVLDFLSKYALYNKKKIFCAFIDFRQAFDTVWRQGLWTKVLKSGIDGKCFRFIKNMYKGIKSKVQIGQHVSNFFLCNVGVRQGENLSPFLFSLFINDLESFLQSNEIVGFNCPNQNTQDDFFSMLKLCILFYADDTVLMSESATDLQKSLDVFFNIVNCGK